MMPSFSAGSVRAYTGRNSASGAVGASPARVTPVRAATAAAVLGWSPVIMTGRMPAARAASTAARASGRTGSANATRPSNAGLPGGPAAIASTRYASLAQSSTTRAIGSGVRSSADTASRAL